MSNSLNNRIKNEYSNRYALLVRAGEFYPINAEESVINDKITTSKTPAYFGNTPDPFRQSLGKLWTYKELKDLSGEVSSPPNVRFLLTSGLTPFSYKGKLSLEGDVNFQDVSALWNDTIFTKGMFTQTLNLDRVATRIKMFFGSLLNYREDASSLLARMTFLSMITDIQKKNNQAAWTINYYPSEAAKQAGEQSSYQIIFNNNAVGVGSPYNFASVVDYDSMGSPQNPSIKLVELLKEFPNTNPIQIAAIQEAYERANQIFASAIWYAGYDGQMRSYYDFIEDTYAYSPNTADAKEANTYATYLDYPFAMPLPMSPRALSLVNTANKTDLVADIGTSYNYYSKFYETAVSKANEVYKMQDGTYRKIDLQDLPLIYNVPLDNQDTPSIATEKADSKYNFESFGHKILNCGYEKNYFHIARDQNIIVDQNSTQFLDKYNNIKRQFPFYVDINFNDDTKREFTTLFNETGMSMRLMRSWILNFFKGGNGPSGLDGVDSSTTPSRNDIVGFAQIKGKYYSDYEDNSWIQGGPDGDIPLDERARICSPLNIYSIQDYKNFFELIPPAKSEDKAAVGTDLIKEDANIQCREYNLNRWLDNYVEYVALSNSDDANSIGSSDPNYDMGISKAYSTYDYKLFYDKEDPVASSYYEGTNQPIEVLQVLNFINRYKKIINTKARSYEDILAGKKAYSETLFYRIQKVFVGDPRAPGDPNKIVQNIWIPKPTGFDEDKQIMKYIDTQIAYNQNYEYTVHAYELVVGSRYGFQYASYIGKNYLADTIVDQLGLTSPTGIAQKVKAVQYDKSYTNIANQEGYNKSGGGQSETETLEANPADGIYGSTPESRAYLYKSTQNESGRMIMMDAICEPEVRLVEVPIYKKSVLVSDAASTAPEIDILPLNKQKNKIKINFLPSTVDRDMEPISILDGDKSKFHKIRLAQNRDLVKSYESLQVSPQVGQGMANATIPLPNSFYVEPKLRFRTDDFPVQYEIYRLTQQPKDYKSFANAQKTILSAEEVASYTDKLQHNKKYYYTFRSIDFHDNPSNPSPVYQVELVENSGVVYPVISIYDFEIQKLGIKSKSFKRYLKIDAESLQGMLNLKESNLDNADSALDNAGIKLGVRNDPLFGVKKFKFRIRSKHTGKLVDLNVQFKTKHIKSVETLESCGNNTLQTSPSHAEVLGAVKDKSAIEEHTAVLKSFP